jgi:hypothetical protein
MKNFNLFVLLASVVLVFSSCSNNDAQLTDDQSLDLLESFTINRDSNGAYSLDYNLSDNAKTETVVDEKVNNIFLYSSSSQTSRRVTQDLLIDGTELKVGFVDTKSDISHNITIKDDNIFLAKDADTGNSKLNDYSISSNFDGTYTLEFSVKNNVRVDFVFNEEIDTYEVHLEEGKLGESNFSKVLEKEEGKALRFDFVNHIVNTQAKSEKTSASSFERKPRGIIL